MVRTPVLPLQGARVQSLVGQHSQQKKKLDKFTACVPQYHFPSMPYGELFLTELLRTISYLICFEVEITLNDFNTCVLLTC